MPSMFISSVWDVKKPTHYTKRVGREVPGVVAVLCELVSEGDIPWLGLRVPFVYHPAFLCKKLWKKEKRETWTSGSKNSPYLSYM